ncbi:hypothetical protein [Desulfofalx alkaliphila]|uniref:hypothetical protein n=1 Tax=Desulfofalx alkaliphila TaxID=105483 RepID=UPI001A9A3B50|nr:hypothetical protein [Desulfofalx alkaliphila]
MKVSQEGIIERILWISEDNAIAYLINPYSNKCNPCQRKVKDIIVAIASGVAEKLSHDPFMRIVKENDIKESHRKIRDKSWQVISEIVNNEPYIYQRNYRRNLIKSCVVRFGISERSIYTYLKRYWQRGKHKNALLPDYHNCGRRGSIRGAYTKKRGRPRKYIWISGEGVNVNEETRLIFKMAIERFYYNSKKNSLMTAYELMRKEFYSDSRRIENGVEKVNLKPIGEVPTFAQFRYWFHKERNFKKEISARLSAKRFQQNHRGILGDSTTEAIGPGSLYQIDATVADVYLVSRFNRSWIIGRPIIYAVIDVFSRMVTGIYIGLEGPSWVGAMMAIANSATDKVKFCREYEIDISTEDWPVHYIPEAIIADRGGSGR